MCGTFCSNRLVTDAVTFFVVVNPLGLVPLFITLTRNEPPSNRPDIARRGVIVAAAILIAFIIVGQIVLNAMGITLSSFRIAGGLVLLMISTKMILDPPLIDEEEFRPTPSNGEAGAVRRSADVAVFPLALPYIAGPGAIMSVVLLTDNARFGIAQQAATTGVLFLVLALTYAVLLLAERLHRLLGETGANVLTRVMGLVLAALAVQSVLAGIRTAFSLH